VARAAGQLCARSTWIPGPPGQLYARSERDHRMPHRWHHYLMPLAPHPWVPEPRNPCARIIRDKAGRLDGWRGGGILRQGDGVPNTPVPGTPSPKCLNRPRDGTSPGRRSFRIQRPEPSPPYPSPVRARPGGRVPVSQDHKAGRLPEGTVSYSIRCPGVNGAAKGERNERP